MALEEALDRAVTEHETFLLTQDGTDLVDRAVALRAEGGEDRLLVGVDPMDL